MQCFIAICCHWIDAHWNLRTVLIGFREVVGSHEGVELAKYVVETLIDMNIQDKVMERSLIGLSGTKHVDQL